MMYFIPDPDLLWIWFSMVGISWGSILSMPYAMLSSSIDPKKMGIMMGIFNMFIVIPMIIQIFSMQYLLYDLLGENPINVIRLAGVFLITGGVFSLFVSNQNRVS